MILHFFRNQTGDLTESDQFKIDVSSGEVSLKKDLTADDFGKRYNLLIVATQDTDKKLTANLQVSHYNVITPFLLMNLYKFLNNRNF